MINRRVVSSLALAVIASAGLAGCATRSGAGMDQHDASAALDRRAQADGAVLPAHGEQRLFAKAPLDASASDARLVGAAGGEDGSAENAQVFGDVESFERAAGKAEGSWRGAVPVVIDFDDLSPYADLSGARLRGVTLLASAAPLSVVAADETYVTSDYPLLRDPATYRLVATSGRQILSPGGPALAPGPDPGAEDDDIVMIFDPPVAALGFDLLTPSADGLSFTNVTVIDDEGMVLYTAGISTARGSTLAGDSPGADDAQFPLPGADFWGFVAPRACIREVRIDEHDSDAICPDANIGIDSLRFAPAPVAAARDLTGDRVVSAADVLAFIARWVTERSAAAPIAAPLNALELARLLAAWGE